MSRTTQKRGINEYKRKKGNSEKNSNSKCLGPIADLEKHLPVEWWRSLFNSIYLKTDADVIENSVSMEALPILEADYSKLPGNLPKILGYESKWYPKLALLDEKTARNLIDASMNLFQRLKCRDYARFDFRMDFQGNPRLLEINPNPGWCWDGKMSLMAEFAGIAYHELLEKFLKAALERYLNLKHD